MRPAANIQDYAEPPFSWRSLHYKLKFDYELLKSSKP